ncbi:hypothetical protein [Microcoleus sp. B3-D7]|uniref:hypothetical protein n=1 Tax=Microcoleus sp. B3-D7 TaxID=2818659 RepID=UPI002FD5CB3D
MLFCFSHSSSAYPATHHPHRAFGTVNTSDTSPARAVQSSLGWLIMALTQHFRFLGIALYGFLQGEVSRLFRTYSGKYDQQSRVLLTVLSAYKTAS